MAGLIGILYIALDAGLAGVLARARPGLHFVSAFFLAFAGGAAGLYALVLCHVPLSLAFAFLAGVKVLVLLWRFPDLRAALRMVGWREIAVVGGFLFLSTLLVARKGLIFWDDWANWGYVARILHHHDGIFTADRGAYYDYMLLQSFYWSAFHLPGQAFQEKLGPAITWFIYALAMRRFFANTTTYCFFTALLPFAFSGEMFGTTYADGMVAVAFALVGVELRAAALERGPLLGIVGPMLLLLFAKPVGVYLALIAVVALWGAFLLPALYGKFRPNADSYFLEKNAPFAPRHVALVSALVLLLVAVKFALVKNFLWQIGAAEAQAMLRTPLEAYRLGFYHAFLRAARDSIFIHDRLLFLVPALFVTHLALLPRTLRSDQVWFFFLASAANFVFILLATLSFFSEQEIRRAASFARYMEHTYLFGIVVLLDSGARLYAVLRERFDFAPGRLSRAALGLVGAGAIWFFGGFVYFFYPYAPVKQAIQTAKACAPGAKLVQIVSQNDSGFFFHVLRFYVYPAFTTGSWQFCAGPKDREGNPCETVPDHAAFAAKLRGVDTILLIQDDDHLRDRLWPKGIPYPAKLPACVHLRGQPVGQ